MYLYLVLLAGVLIKAFQSVLTDEDFDLPTPPAIKARKSAQCVLTWCTDNHPAMYEFTQQLMCTLKVCFVEHKKQNVRRDKMWEQYYLLRSSSNFTENWTRFLQLSGAEATPTLYQHITDIIFNFLIKEHFISSEPTQAITSTPTLDYNERNALRYITGYISRKLYRTLKDSSHKLKDELCLCIAELNDVDPDELSEESNDWMRAVDRGGLKHVTNMTFAMLASAEVELRKHIHEHTANELNLTVAKEKILCNDDVQFYWEMVSVDWKEEVTTVLLELVIDEYLKIRGHSTASAFMEKYKKESKKSVQKSKGVRKQLLSKGASAINSDHHSTSED